MPYLGLGLHVIVALYFAVHVVRSGQDRYWLMILFMFPLLGSVVYALAIWLPGMRHSHQGRELVRGVKRVLDPTRTLREAQEAFDTAATTDTRLRLADALLAAGNASEAVPQYQAALRGIHNDDPEIQVRLARALLESGQVTPARELLDTLIRDRPQFRSQDGHLTYARAVAAEGNRAKAREEFEALIGYGRGYEASARYAETLHGWGEHDRAGEICATALAQTKRLPAYARRINKPLIAQLQQLSTQIDKVAQGTVK